MTIGQPQAEPQDRLSKCLRGASFRDSGGSRNRKFRKHIAHSGNIDLMSGSSKPSCPEGLAPRWREAASKDAPEDIGAAAGDVKERRFPPANLGIDSNACRPRKTRSPMAPAPRPHEPRSGKTTLAQIVARGLGVGFRATSGPVHPARRRPSPQSQSSTCPISPRSAPPLRRESQPLGSSSSAQVRGHPKIGFDAPKIPFSLICRKSAATPSSGNVN